MRTPVRRLVLAALLTTAALPAAARAAGSGDIVAFFKAADIPGQPVSLGDLVARRRVAVFFWDWRRATSTRAMQAARPPAEHLRKAGSGGCRRRGGGQHGGGGARARRKTSRHRQRAALHHRPGSRGAHRPAVPGREHPQIFLLDGAGRVFFHLEGFRADDEPAPRRAGQGGPGHRRASGRRRSHPVAATQPAPPPRPSRPRAAARRGPDAPPCSRNIGTSATSTSIGGAGKRPRSISARSSRWRRTTRSAWLHIGESCARQRRYDQAREAWEQVLRLEPGNREADANIRRLIRGEYCQPRLGAMRYSCWR